MIAGGAARVDAQRDESGREILVGILEDVDEMVAGGRAEQHDTTRPAGGCQCSTWSLIRSAGVSRSRPSATMVSAPSRLTYNTEACGQLVADLVDRGLDASRGMLFVIDGGKALTKAIRAVSGPQLICTTLRSAPQVQVESPNHDAA